MVVIAGEPGIGKTRLARQFAQELQAAVHSSCSGAAGGTAGAVRALRGGAAPGRCRRGPASGLRGCAGARQRLFDAVDGALSGVAGARALLLVLDDCTGPTAARSCCTSFLLRSHGPARCSCWAPTATRSSVATGRWPRRSRTCGARRAGPRGAARAGRGGRRRARPRAAGRRRGRRGRARPHGWQRVLRRGGAARPGRERRGARERAPGGRRAARPLGRDANDLLAAAAVLGLECDAETLVDAAGLEPAAAEGARRAPAGAAAGAGGDRAAFEFAHALVREAVYDELNVLRRARLHRQAAEALTRPRRGRATSRRSRRTCSRPRGRPTRGSRPTRSPAPGGGPWNGSPTRTPPSASRGRSRRSSSPAREDDAGPVLLARGDALLRAGEPAAARGRSRLPRDRAPRARTPSCWPRRRSASPVSAWRSPRSTRWSWNGWRRRWRRSPRDPVLRSRADGPARRGALLRREPRALGDAQRGGGRRRARAGDAVCAGGSAERPPRRAVAARPARRAAPPSRAR